MDKGAAGEKWQLHHLTPVAPATNAWNQRQKIPDALVPELSKDLFLVSRASMNRVSTKLCRVTFGGV